MATRTRSQKPRPKAAKAKTPRVVRDLDAKRKSADIKGGIIAVLIGTSQK